MKTIIAGSRTITDYSLVEKAIKESGFNITEVVCGEARGVDSLGKLWAIKNNIPVESFHAPWNLYGKSAGFVRNEVMVRYADALIAVTTGSNGTAHTIELAQKKPMPVFVLKV